jgi:hypothetical protein
VVSGVTALRMDEQILHVPVSEPYWAEPITMEGDLGTYAPFSLAKWSRSSMVTLGSET